MARTQAVNYTAVGAAGTDYNYTDSSNDPYQRTELQRLGKATDLHDHAPGRGLAVARVAAGSIVTASLADLNVTKPKLALAAVGMEQIDWPSIASCIIFSSVNLALAHNTETLVLLNSERSDLLGMHSTSVNTGRINILTTGIYDIGATFAFASNSVGRREIFTRANGVTYIDGDQRLASNGDRTTLRLGRKYPCAAGDYIEFTAFQTSTVTLNLEAVGNRGIEAWATRVGG